MDQSILEAVLSRIENMDDLSKKFLGMIYGPMGGGKTTLAMMIAQAITPPDEEIFYLDSAQNWVVLGPDLTRRTQRVHLTGYLGVQGAGALVETGKLGNIGTVVIDEHSSFFDADLQEVTQNNAKKDPSKSPDAPQWPDMNQTINRWVVNENMWIATGKNIIFVSHDRVDSDDKKVPVTAPNYLPKAISKLCRPMHLVGLVTADVQESESDPAKMYKRSVQCHPTRRVVAKCRLPELPLHASFEEVVAAAVNLVQHGKMLEDEVPETTLPNEHLSENLSENDPATIGD